jgi:hypothetical protein
VKDDVVRGIAQKRFPSGHILKDTGFAFDAQIAIERVLTRA